MDSLLAHPSRNLVRVAAFMVVVWTAATFGYVEAGWSFPDALYMVTLTVFTVGYGEVHPIDTPYLHLMTMATMALGCTGMIFFTGALVQFFTLRPLQAIMGERRMQTEIDKLDDHIIVCGFGRIGVELAKALHDGAATFVLVEQNGTAARRRATPAISASKATPPPRQPWMRPASHGRGSLATVLPNDAANVFITLSARNLNPAIQIIARGDAVTTESKLVHAGANKVVLPTHIGAERIAEMILFPETARFIFESGQMRDLERTLRGLGLAIEVVVVPQNGAFTDLTIDEIETRAHGTFFIVQLNRRDGEAITEPDNSLHVAAGDGLVLVGRSGQAMSALFAAPKERVRAGRTVF